MRHANDDPVPAGSADREPRLGSTARRLRISAFMPSYNEVASLPAVVAELQAVLESCAEHWEIIVVDDGSTDETDALLARMNECDARVRTVRHPVNRGYGAALRTGIEAATLDWIFFTDADGQFDLWELRELLPFTADADLVIGYRMPRRDPPARIVVSRVYNLMMRALFRLTVRDIDCSFKLGRSDVLKPVKLHSDTGLAETELLLGALHAGARLVERRVRHLPRSHGASRYEVSLGGRLGMVRPRTVVQIVVDMRRHWPALWARRLGGRRPRRTARATGHADRAASCPPTAGPHNFEPPPEASERKSS
jgi:glycosyltransferase involved in cell wall biosynthesis